MIFWRKMHIKRYLLSLVLLPLTFLFSGCGLINTGVRTAIALVPLKLLFSCLPEGTMIDTPNGSRAVETLKPGEMVVGFKGRPVKVLQIHAYAEESTDEFLKIQFEDGAVVDLCKKHRIHGIRAGSLEVGDELKSGHIVESILAYGKVERSYDILTEDKGYQIGGVPVNSMIEEMYESGRSGGRMKRD